MGEPLKDLPFRAVFPIQFHGDPQTVNVFIPSQLPARQSTYLDCLRVPKDGDGKH